MLDPNRITKIRLFYSQHILPLVYDYSLSFYEALCKIAGVLNDTIEVVEDIDDRVTQNTEKITDLGDIVNGFDDRIQAAEDKADQALEGVNDLRPTVVQNAADIRDHSNAIADLQTRVALLEGYAGWGSLTPATTDDLDDLKDEIEDDFNDRFDEVEELIDALIQGGYTPTYGTVDFGKGVLLRAAPTELDPNHMEIASEDFQVSAAYVQALNMVYGNIYISMSEGANVNAIPGDTFVLCWKNSTELPPIASDFPGVKVQWDSQLLHTPDLFKMGIDYNNTFTKRVDCFYGKRDQYADYVGTGYKWYAPVYLNNIATGSPVTNWAIIQIPFCYLSLRSLNTWDYEMTTPLSLDGATVLNTEVKPFSAANNGRSFEYYASFAYDDNDEANFGTSMLMSLNTSSTAGTGSMYWTGASNDDNLTSTNLKVRDPGFGIGGGSNVAKTYIQDCIRGTNFRKRSGNNSFTMKSVNDDNCSENVFHILYDSEAKTFTATLTHRYADNTEDESEIVLDLHLNGAAMAFSDSDMPLLIGGCLTADYTVGTYQRYVGSASAPVTLNYCRFRYL